MRLTKLQKQGMLGKTDKLAEPSETEVNNPDAIDFTVILSAFPIIDGQGPMLVPAKMGVHTTWMLRRKLESWVGA